MEFPIFLFHRVNPVRDPLWDPMDPVLFEKCISYISNKYTIVSLEESLAKGFPSSIKRPAAIVFDDGYKDNIQFAVPILQKYKCPCSFYIVTDCIDKDIVTWTHLFEHLFKKTKKERIVIESDTIPDALLGVVWNHENEKLQYASQLKPLLKTLPHVEREKILQQIITQFDDVVELPKDIMMNWNDIRTLKAMGYTIGSHSVTHAMLGTIEDSNVIHRELHFSAQRIQEELNEFPLTISYPIGSYSDAVLKQSKEVGYSFGLAVHQSCYNTKVDNIYAIPRIELYNESWLKTRMRISGVLERIKKIIR